jgi:hypothetical protein
MALYEMIECGQCGQRNRVLPETGTKGIRCGRCRGDLPTPAVFHLLLQVKTELSELMTEYRVIDIRGRHKEIERKLRKQQSILANAAVAYPGYDRTWRASIELAADIETLSQDLQKKFDHQATRKVVQIIIEIVRMIHINISGVPALPSGSTIS